jgi:FMN reductase
MKLLAVSGSPSAPSKTVTALEVALDHARTVRPDLDVALLNLRDLRMEFSDGRDPAAYEGDTRRAIDEVVDADALIVGTPMYRGSYTGRLKNLFDVLPNDALAGTPVGLVATGGTDHHFLAIEHQLKPLLGFFHAHALPGAVYANNGHFSGGRLTDDGIRARLEQLAEAVVTFAERMPAGLVGAAGPEIPRRSLADS